ncbi:hypothetical protein AB0L40_10475 [Patulibacter sp. NPDC049589]|uniref:hypothetical protein n=1 Tax=Patulibacter sp. NPDC049589 TaxID=3154731 RepID=UPI0034460701
MTQLSGVHPLGRTARSAVLAVVVAALSALVFALPHTASASTRSCSTPTYPGVGYFTSLKVTNTTCGTGTKVLKGYYKCRIKHGKTGRCTSKVVGFRCTEKRNSIPTEFLARVTCKKGKVTVVHTYQQDT